MSHTLRHSHVPGHPPWLQGAPIDAPRFHRGHLHDHDTPTPPPLLALTTLRPGTGDALHKAARLAHTLGIRAGEGYGVYAGLCVPHEGWATSARARASHRPERLLSGCWAGDNLYGTAEQDEDLSADHAHRLEGAT